MSKIQSLVCTFVLCVITLNGYKCDSLDCETNVLSVFAAIDIGDANSRWAYVPLHGSKKMSSLRQWEKAFRFIVQDQTHVLIEADGDDLKFVAFGTDAETKYTELPPEKQAKFHYLKRFKGQVRDKEVLSPATTVKDSNGQLVNAQKVFELAIQFQKDEIMTSIYSLNLDYDMTKFLWVVTAWDDSENVKQFMKTAAILAGINPDSLMVAAEADVASIYGRLILKEEFFGDQDDSTTLKPRTKYITLVAGAGSSSVIVNEVIDDEKLRQIVKAYCHHCGGLRIDELFFEMLETVLGKKVLQNFQDDCQRDNLHMLRQFEIEKKPVSHDEAIVIKIRISECLQKIVKKLTGQSIDDRIAQSEFKNHVWFSKDTLYIGADLIKNGFYLGEVHKITNTVQTALDKTKGNDEETALITLGGFSDSAILQQEIKSLLYKAVIIRSSKPDLAVVKGAVMHAYDPLLITERWSQYTYGISTTGPFVEGVHDPSKKIFINGRPHSKELFQIFLEKGQSVKKGEILFSKVHNQSIEGSLTLPIPIYECKNSSPVHVTDAGCVRFNYESIEARNWNGHLQRNLLVELSFTGFGFLLNVTNMQNEGTVLSFTNNFSQLF